MPTVGGEDMFFSDTSTQWHAISSATMALMTSMAYAIQINVMVSSN